MAKQVLVRDKKLMVRVFGISFHPQLRLSVSRESPPSSCWLRLVPNIWDGGVKYEWQISSGTQLDSVEAAIKTYFEFLKKRGCRPVLRGRAGVRTAWEAGK